MNEVKKTPAESKTIWTGTAITVIGLAGLVVEVWSLLGYEETQFLDRFFGPEVMTVVGIVMIALRVVTRSPVR